MNALPRLRLLQLLNPALPVGTYSYSQGIEWACHNGWLHDVDSVGQWILDGLHGPLVHQELPLLRRLFAAAKENNVQDFRHWAQCSVAFRDTKELRLEDTQRARSIVRLLKVMPDVHLPATVMDAVSTSALAAIAWPAAGWKIDEADLLNAFGFFWLDSQINASVKLVPLGQSEGQRLLHQLSEAFSHYDVLSINPSVEEIGFSLPAQSMASMQHEDQYSRIYRS